MCGIGGVLWKSQPATKKDLETIGSLIKHRGPDEHGIFLRDNLGLIHSRLSIIDLKGGRQPLCADNPNIVLIANGEIYNFKEIREQLNLRGRDTCTLSDCEVIIHAYLEFGLDFIQKIAGMFAFALWDGEKRRLLLGRDRLGIKPLYYLERDDGLFFASEIKALVPFMKAKEIHPPSLVEGLQNQFSSGRNTILSGVKRVLPGEMLIVEQGQVRSMRYWDLTRTSPIKIDYNGAEEMFSSLFETVMVQHMRADVPYGVFLSGGVDSATVLAMISRLQTNKILSFSVGYKGVEMKDELDDAQRIARLFNTEHVPIVLEANEMFSRIPHMVWSTDEFMWDYACLPTSFLAEHARNHSLKVVFTGEGGDEVFAGYGRYRKTFVECLVKKMANPKSGGFRTRGRWRNPWPRKVFGDKLAQFSKSYKTPFINAWSCTPPAWDYTKKAQYTDIVTELPEDLLVKVDRMLMAFGVEGRVPFLDHRVVEFGLSLPRSLKIRPHYGKVFLRRWAEKDIPMDHLWKKKRGFHVPIGEWLTGDFLNRLEEKLLQNKAIGNWFQRDGIRELFSAQRAKKKASREIWGLMHFAIWHNLFIEKSCSVAPSTKEDPLEFIS
ncbi:Asparagine synthetase (glutamine-hydrolyzing) [Dissulfuribacter thermophilus]|uniref:asparagine synthase (glutamine-hydrolyzing) n=1 Tax=Dissulfuribacter thermophilus TaxID=1156395 RepID=A0A1B9F6N6_9BACT|nr:asparagine synthase (glutamine-hydrolyzing) [Dissulfuribacter thermophilus]OCC15597.1 Asparagine synthetase (glutamine-hydrolyzing) [Dissulfuribacter thermophilus]